MEKEQILNILYSERNRLKDRYEMPGWSPWAIVAALATLFVEVIKTCYESQVCYSYSFGITFFLVTLSFSLTTIYTLFKIKPNPIWSKGDNVLRVGAIYFFACNLAISYWFKTVAFDNLNSWVAYPVNASLYLLTFLYGGIFALSFTETLKNQKADGSGYVLLAIYAVICVSIGLYCFDNWNAANESTLLLGLYVFAIIMLTSLLYSSRTKKLADVDHIIDKALYNDEVDPKALIEELEEVTVGLRYGKYLIESNQQYIDFSKKHTLWALNSIYEELTSKYVSPRQHDIIANYFGIAEAMSKQLQSTSDYLKKMVKLGYDKKTDDRYKTQVEDIITKIDKLVEFCTDSKKKFETMKDPKNFEQCFIAEYKEFIK